MSKHPKLGFICILLFLILNISAQNSSDSVEEGDFCSEDEDCGPPKFICSQNGDLSFCKRKEVFPLYGKISRVLVDDKIVY